MGFVGCHESLKGQSSTFSEALQAHSTPAKLLCTPVKSRCPAQRMARVEMRVRSFNSEAQEVMQSLGLGSLLLGELTVGFVRLTS